jgi:hypothetical protein
LSLFFFFFLFFFLFFFFLLVPFSPRREPRRYDGENQTIYGFIPAS